MTNIVYTKSLNAPEINKKEILRYAECKDDSPELTVLLDDALSEALMRLEYKVCYARFNIVSTHEYINLGFTKTSSSALKKCLADCDEIIAFVATVGIGADRLISRYSAISPARAVMLDAICTERIEALCDEFERGLREELSSCGLALTGRFSPGYGDLSLTVARDMFDALECPRRIGVYLKDNLIMSPSKSVSALIGIKRKQERLIKG